MYLQKYPGLRTAIAMTLVGFGICLGFSFASHRECAHQHLAWKDANTAIREQEHLIAHGEGSLQELDNLHAAKDAAFARWLMLLNYDNAWRAGTLFFLITPITVYLYGRWYLRYYNWLYEKPPLR